MRRSRTLRDRRTPEAGRRDRRLDQGPTSAPGVNSAPPQPARIARAHLPQALTFFLTVSQRRAVLGALRRLNPRREVALLQALGLAPPIS